MASPTSIRWIVGKNTIAQLVGKIIGAGITFIITILIARRFGADGYGDFTKITTYIAFFYLVADFGINAVFLHKIEGASPREGHVLWHVLVSLRTLLSVLLILLSIVFIAVIPQGISQGYTPLVKLGVLLFSFTILFQAILTTGNAVFQKYLRYDLSTVATSIGSVLSLLLLLVASSGNHTILAVIGSLMIGSMITAAVALFFAARLLKTWTITFPVAQMKELFFASVPLAATLIFNLVYFRVDSIILTFARSTTEVGIYGFAYKFFEFPLVLPTFFMNSLYPILLSAKRYSNDRFMVIIKKAAVILFFSSISCSIVFWIAAPLIYFVRPEFSQSIVAIRILVTGLPFFFLSSLTMWILITLKKQRELAVVYFIAMCCNLGLNLLFIPRFGFIAASWITVISEFVVLLATSLLVLKNKVDYA